MGRQPAWWDYDEDERSARVAEQAERYEQHGTLCRCAECNERDVALFGHARGPVLQNDEPDDDAWRIGGDDFESHFTRVVRHPRAEPAPRFL